MFKKRPNILNHCVYISASAIWLLYHWVKIGTFSFPSTLESQNIISPLAPSWFPLSFRQIRAYIARRSVNEGAGGITPPPPSHLKKGHTPLPPLPPSLSLQADISIFYMIKLPSNLSFFLQTRYNGGPASFTCVSSHVPISRAHINIILYTQLSPFSTKYVISGVKRLFLRVHWERLHCDKVLFCIFFHKCICWTKLFLPYKNPFSLYYTD